MTANINQGIRRDLRNPANNASATWLAARKLSAPARTPWMVMIALEVAHPRGTPADAKINTRLYIEIDNAEWGILFCRGGGSSRIRVVNTPRVQDHDTFGLLPHVTELRNLGGLVQLLERRFHIQFRRPNATIHTDLVAAHQKILLWVVFGL
jgi:hypothetical protein